jgi:hypothetical protein
MQGRDVVTVSAGKGKQPGFFYQYHHFYRKADTFDNCDSKILTS